MMRSRKKKKTIQKRRMINKRMWEEFGQPMNGKEYDNMTEMTV